MREKADSTAGPLRIDAVALPGSGIIGMTHLPGRRHRDGQGRQWRRELEDDLRAIEDWGAQMLVTLVESEEFGSYGVPRFARRAAARRFVWRHFPIADMQIPGADFATAWNRDGGDLIRRLARGERIVVHCAGGFGRTGMIAARILVELGAQPASAIAAIRAARPGAIETAAQEHFVLSRAALGSTPQRIGGE